MNHLNSPPRDQKPNPLPDRKALDDIVFDLLGLTEDERDEVYWAVCELVANRLNKAKSLDKECVRENNHTPLFPLLIEGINIEKAKNITPL